MSTELQIQTVVRAVLVPDGVVLAVSRVDPRVPDVEEGHVALQIPDLPVEVDLDLPSQMLDPAIVAGAQPERVRQPPGPILDRATLLAGHLPVSVPVVPVAQERMDVPPVAPHAVWGGLEGGEEVTRGLFATVQLVVQVPQEGFAAPVLGLARPGHLQRLRVPAALHERVDRLPHDQAVVGHAQRRVHQGILETQESVGTVFVRLAAFRAAHARLLGAVRAGERVDVAVEAARVGILVRVAALLREPGEEHPVPLEGVQVEVHEPVLGPVPDLLDILGRSR